MRAVPATAPQDTGLDLQAFQNLGYTFEWFAFAGFVVFMWFRLLRREVEFARDAELGLVPDEEHSPSPSGV
jgi:cytochrome oxidase assembly protein ShyY1